MPPAYEILLLNTAVPQIQAAQSGDTYVVPRDIAFSAALTLSAGTANGVPYLNGSKVLTTGSALTFDGTDFSNTAGKVIAGGDLRATITGTGNVGLNIARTGGVTADWYNYVPSGSADLAWFKGSELMRLTSTGLGIGANNPGYKLEVNGIAGVKTSSANAAEFHVNNTNASARDWILLSTGSAWAGGGQTGYFNIYDNTASQQRLTIDTSGNLGLGVTPSAWTSTAKVFEVGATGSFSNSGAGDTAISDNRFYNGSNNIYKTTNPATIYSLASGQHRWFTAPSGTVNSASVTSGASYTVVALGSSTLAEWQAFFNDSSNNPLTVTPTLGQVLTGNATGTLLGGGLVTQIISFTQAMTLDASGNLVVGTTNNGAGARLKSKVSAGTFGLEVTDEVQSDFIVSPLSGAVCRVGPSAGAMAFYAGNGERARITSGGDFQTASGNSVMIGGTAARATTAGTNRLDIFDGTAPVGTLANGVSFYSTAGEARVMDAAGNATLLSPHDTETNEWIFHSKHTPTGKVLRIDVERLLKFVNDHFGLDAVQEFIEE